jgi:hypothetical protein
MCPATVFAGSASVSCWGQNGFTAPSGALKRPVDTQNLLKIGCPSAFLTHFAVSAGDFNDPRDSKSCAFGSCPKRDTFTGYRFFLPALLCYNTCRSSKATGLRLSQRRNPRQRYRLGGERMTQITPAHHHGKIWRAFCFHQELASVLPRFFGPGLGGLSDCPCAPMPPASCCPA